MGAASVTGSVMTCVSTSSLAASIRSGPNRRVVWVGLQPDSLDKWVLVPMVAAVGVGHG